MVITLLLTMNECTNANQKEALWSWFARPCWIISPNKRNPSWWPSIKKIKALFKIRGY
jgi:hypothetical protein